jgi:hypothetical protein
MSQSQWKLRFLVFNVVVFAYALWAPFGSLGELERSLPIRFAAKLLWGPMAKVAAGQPGGLAAGTRMSQKEGIMYSPFAGVGP